MKKISLLFLLATLCLWSSSTQAQPANPFAFFEPYEGLLQTHLTPVTVEGVGTMGVDYTGWAADRRYLTALALLKGADTSLLTTPAQKISFWLNAYNLLTIHLIIREGEGHSIKNLGHWFTGPWQRYRFRVGGQTLTLDEIENDLLRPLGEARIHFALNCASLSCPDLRWEAYSPEKLDTQLAGQLTTFLNNPTKGARVEKHWVVLSKIFNWYRQDFAGGNLEKWLDERAPGFRGGKKLLGSLDYNWNLNAVPGRALAAPAASGLFEERPAAPTYY